MLYEALFKIVFQYGFEPKKEDFREFTEEHYEKFRRENGETSEKMYMFLPKNSANEMMALTEREKNSLLKAARVIEKYCARSEEKFNTYEDKLRYTAKVLPTVFSEGTKFARSIPTALPRDTENSE